MHLFFYILDAFIWLNNMMRNIWYVDLEYFISYFNYVVIFSIIYYLFVVKVRVMCSGTGI